MSRDFRVTITDPASAGSVATVDWHRHRVRTFPHPRRGGHRGQRATRVYILDEQQLTPAQRLALCEGLADLFDAAAWEVDQDMRSKGILILADQCSVTVLNPQRWLLCRLPDTRLTDTGAGPPPPQH